MSRSAVHLYRHIQAKRSRAEVVRQSAVPVRDRFATAHALGWRPLS
jgi:hypothetical protein